MSVTESPTESSRTSKLSLCVCLPLMHVSLLCWIGITLRWLLKMCVPFTLIFLPLIRQCRTGARPPHRVQWPVAAKPVLGVLGGLQRPRYIAAGALFALHVRGTVSKTWATRNVKCTLGAWLGTCGFVTPDRDRQLALQETSSRCVVSRIKPRDISYTWTIESDTTASGVFAAAISLAMLIIPLGPPDFSHQCDVQAPAPNARSIAQRERIWETWLPNFGAWVPVESLAAQKTVGTNSEVSVITSISNQPPRG
jgi:hypothetical protein